MKVTSRILASTSTQAIISKTQPTPYSWINNATPGPSTGKLAGKQIAIKENISYSAAPTSCSSQILEEYYPPYDATCVTSLLSAGAHIVGQTKMDEFGMGSETTHMPPSYTAVHNPASPDPSQPPRSAGGSSGGSAAAVASGSAWAALGTDTGGSVRLPASYCGIVGLKPSYGMISRYGIISYADSLDCVGVLGQTIDTVQKVYNVVSHPDKKDMTCQSPSTRQKAKSILSSHLQHFPNYRTGSINTNSNSFNNLRIGIPKELNLPSPRIQIPSSLLDHLQSLGAELREISIPSLKLTLPAYYVLASAEASSNLARFGGGWFGSRVKTGFNSYDNEIEGEFGVEEENESGEERRRRLRTEGFGKEVKKRILAGTYALSANEFNNTYLKALHLRRQLRNDLLQTFRTQHPHHLNAEPPREGIDILLHPTSICTAPLLRSTSDTRNIQDSEYDQDLLTVPASLAGLPSLSVPSGKGDDGWPIGMSLMGQWGMEEMLFWAGTGVESWKSS